MLAAGAVESKDETSSFERTVESYFEIWIKTSACECSNSE